MQFKFSYFKATSQKLALKQQSLESSDTVFVITDAHPEPSTLVGYIAAPRFDHSFSDLQKISNQVAECLDFASYVSYLHSQSADERYDHYRHLQSGRRTRSRRIRLDTRLDYSERELRCTNLRHVYLAYLVLSNEFQRCYYQTKTEHRTSKTIEWFKQFEQADLRIKAHFCSNLRSSFGIGTDTVYANQMSSRQINDLLNVLEVVQPDVDSGHNDEMDTREMEWRHYSSISKMYNAESRFGSTRQSMPVGNHTVDYDKMIQFQKRIELCLAGLQVLEDEITAVNLATRIHRLLAFAKDDSDTMESMLWDLRDCMLYLKKFVDHVSKLYTRFMKILVKMPQEMSLYPPISRAIACYTYTFATIGRFKI